MVEKGQPWERPASGPAAWHVEGDDAALAAAVRDQPGARVGFRPDPSSDLARALGIHASGLQGPDSASLELGIDALRITTADRALFAVNMVVVGTAPDRTGWFTGSPDLRIEVDGRVVHDGPATTVVVASGQYLRGQDVVPRGHPGDGRLEVQVYALRPAERAGMRRRLATGTHLPHPRIVATTGRSVEVRAAGATMALTLDGVAAGRHTGVRASVRHPALRLLI